MTTTARLKRLVRPFLASHPDLVFHDRWLVMKPVHHVFRGILLDRTSMSQRTATHWIVQHLFEVKTFIPLNWGRGFVWLDLDDPEHLNMLVKELETEVLPKMRSIATIESLVDYVDGHNARHRLFDTPETKIIFDVALGKLDAARMLGAEHIDYWSSDSRHWDEQDRQQMSRLRQLYGYLMGDDRAGMAGLLHDWEATTVRNVRLEALWEPTPFPLEIVVEPR